MSTETGPGAGAAADGGKALDFIRAIVTDDLKAGRNGGRVHTRFPPEPNGYLHIGHAKSICLNFGVALEFGGGCNLRFDDTNPAKEDVEYVDAIREDVHWLGFDWEGREFYASDYFEQLYLWAEELIQKGLAYVDNLTPDEVREHRGTLTEPGRESPYRNRPIAENLDLFRRMRAGEFEDGSYTLRAKIDMASPNINMRDPALYRIRRVAHHRTGDAWCIYPMYDFAHALSDAIEGITHSLCTLEFEDHRPLYDWCVANCTVPSVPRQIEFARLNLTYTVMSKRRLLTLVQEGVVSGWDDPRMPTIGGLRRRGYTPEAIREFAARIGVAKRENLVDVALLEDAVRDDLNRRAPRAMAVLRPLKVVIENYPQGQVETISLPLNPDRPEAGSRAIPFSRELYIERDDFMEEPPKKFFRLSPGREVRLRGTYFLTCERVMKNDEGEIVELRCTYDPATRDGNSPDGRKPKATIHWVSAAHAVAAEVRLYDRLFTNVTPGDEADGGDWRTSLNPASLEVLSCPVEPLLAAAKPGDRFQFERIGYFCVDSASAPGRPVFNRTVPLKDSWARVSQRTGG
jgi:glutaminyl-tRNA synthetase